MTDTRIFCETFGRGPHRLLFIHGWFWDSRVFGELLDALPAETFTCATFDIRGYGSRRDVPGNYSVGEMAADALSVADVLGWDNFAVVGHSMGGKAAQKLAIDQPDRVEALVLVTPVPAVALPFDAATRAFFEQACGDDALAAAIVRQSVGAEPSDQWVEDLVAMTRATALPQAYRGYMRSFVNDDFSDEAAKLVAPMKVVFGKRDNGVAEADMRPIYEELYAHASFQTISGAGHYPMLDTPAELANCITAFLTRA